LYHCWNCGAPIPNRKRHRGTKCPQCGKVIFIRGAGARFVAKNNGLKES